MIAGQLTILLGLIFFAILVYVGSLTRRWIYDASDFILAGRQVSTGLNVFGVASIGFAGTSISLVPGFAVLYGFWPTYINQVIFCLFGLILYGIFFTPFIRRCGAQTLPEWLEMRYNANVRLIVTVGTIFGLTGIMANNVVSIAITITGFIDIPLNLTISVMFLIFLLFSYAGGLWAITFTDFIQLVLGLVAIPLIVTSLFISFGSPGWLITQDPTAWTLGPAGVFPVFSLRFPSYFTSLILFATFLVWGNNYYWLRTASCRTEKAARNSYIWAGILLLLIFYLPLALVGVYARVAFPDLLGTADYLTATSAYGLFLRQVPVFLASFFLLVPLAAGISTATTAHIGATSVILRDIYQRRIKPDANQRQLLGPSRVILLTIGILVWLLCFFPGGPVYLFAFANAWLGPPAMLIVLGITWRRFTSEAAFWTSVISTAAMFILTLTEIFGLFSIDPYMHVGLVGLIVGIITALVSTALTKPAYYGEKSWEKSAATGERVEYSLDESGLEVLNLIWQGYKTMSELADITGSDAADINQVIEKLDRGGFIERQSLRGAGFYTFILAEKAAGFLPEQNSQQARLVEQELTIEKLLVLQSAEKGKEKLAELVRSGKFTSLKMSVLLSSLVRSGYLVEKGMWKRSLMSTDSGKLLLKKNKDLILEV